jgi:hypothetical protein
MWNDKITKEEFDGIVETVMRVARKNRDKQLPTDEQVEELEQIASQLEEENNQ